MVATTALTRFGFLQACYELDDSSDCSSDSEDDCHSRCSEDDEDYDRDRNPAVNNGEPQESGSPQTMVELPSAIVVDDDLRRAADIPLPPSPAPVLNSPLEVAHLVPPPFDNSMDIDATEQPSEPSVQLNDSIYPNAPAIPHDSTVTATQSSCPSSPPSKKVNEEVEEEGCFDISPEQKRQRALDKGKGRAPHDDPQEAPVAVEPIDTTLAATDQQEQETKKAVEEEDRCPTPTPAVSTRRRYRPILTTRSSHGWVWNQVWTTLPLPLMDHVLKAMRSQELFVPTYMKDRCIAVIPELPSLTFSLHDPSTASSNGATREFEVDSVGITLTPDDLRRVLPRTSSAHRSFL